ncbi:hypothetical protein ACIBP6_30865 [Nonomuraea terrae]|uniref:hypothetical protein n=1 Tax=Nonomuraea terrae TaxID=2530383 RepID=UPI0037B1720E
MTHHILVAGEAGGIGTAVCELFATDERVTAVGLRPEPPAWMAARAGAGRS